MRTIDCILNNIKSPLTGDRRSTRQYGMARPAKWRYHLYQCQITACPMMQEREKTVIKFPNPLIFPRLKALYKMIYCNYRPSAQPPPTHSLYPPTPTLSRVCNHPTKLSPPTISLPPNPPSTTPNYPPNNYTQT